MGANTDVLISFQSKKYAVDNLVKQFRGQTKNDIAVAGTKLAKQEIRVAARRIEKEL